MKKSFLYISIVIGISFTLLQGCSAISGSENAVVVAGEVLEKASGNAIDNAIVQISTPPELEQEAITDSTGSFSFSLEVNETTEITLQIDKQGYAPVSKTFKIAPGVDETDLIIELVSEDATGGGDGGTTDEVGGEPEGPAAIILTSIPTQAIFIKETGDNISTAFTFQVVDSAGRALNSEGSVEVKFSILSGPGGGEEIIPASATTNGQGQVTTSLFSGNKAGPVKVQALIERPEVGVTIKSTPVLVAIHGGFPDYEHFSIAPTKYNFEGYDFNGTRNVITVIVGDKFSNPVKPGTVVYFKTTGGVIQGSGQTNNDGIVTVDLISADPRPNDAILGSGGRPGYSTVTATTVGENNTPISKSINIVFSTSGAIINASPLTFDLQPNGGASFTYTVTDLNGNPMAAGTQIKVDAGEGMEVTGDADFTLGNHLFPGPGATEFNFSIRDTDEMADDAAKTTIKISVTAPSGETSTFSGITGTRRKTIGN